MVASNRLTYKLLTLKVVLKTGKNKNKVLKGKTNKQNRQSVTIDKAVMASPDL